VIVKLAKVNEGETKAKQEELAKTNGSYICEALVPIECTPICFATLHVIIGIQNSFLEHLLTMILRHHETACLSELSLLTEGRDNLLKHIKEIRQWRYFYQKDYKIAEEQRKEYFPLYFAAVKDKTTTEGDRKELEKKYKGALVCKKRADKIRAAFKGATNVRGYHQIILYFHKKQARAGRTNV
jgi:hypothetical protein